MANHDSDIQAIIERNKRVELDKAWETSIMRRGFIALLTYAITALLFWINDLPIPLLQALIPSAAYVISTLSLRHLQYRWMRGRSEPQPKH